MDAHHGPDPSLSDADALQAIVDLMDGVEWTPQTIEEISGILFLNGRQVREPDPTKRD